MSEVEISVEVRASTEKAILVYDGSKEIWIPRSQILDECEEGGKTTSIFLREWYANKLGLI